ncbi:DNA integrity scanning protein DisA nucleotide-binding domain protein [Oleidesulfovibrio sp.]|uniref:DNA integrity scanning protein DisA nucleotide-binding domain protein n=1 Tax=Oleidesulfovibrio sp. TaxID=2909707 RepID=UPI003A84FA58
MKSLYRSLFIHNSIDGLREGLSHFSGQSRIALLLALSPDDPIHVIDPQQLLTDHAPRLDELYRSNTSWKSPPTALASMRSGDIYPAEDPELTGLLAFGGHSNSAFFQMWFTEQHPDLCSSGPTLRWLEHAACQLAQDMALSGTMRNSTSGFVLQSYAFHAIRDYIVDQRNYLLGPDTQLRIYPTLDAVLGISCTREEGAWPCGRLAFVEPYMLLRMDFIASFPRMEQPSLRNLRHCRKFLQAVEHSGRTLVADGRSIVGITCKPLPPGSLVADFQGRHGFLYLDDESICGFEEGVFNSSNRTANLVQFEEALLESSLPEETQLKLRRIVSHIVRHARERKHGCTLAVDLRHIPRNLAGQSLHTPLDLQDINNLELATSLSKIDGALHITGNGELLNFACLLDGSTVPGENRARGARFNSALRFTAAHGDMIVIVVSSDRPVSIIQRGIELTARCEWSPLPGFAPQPPSLESWLKE